MSENINYKQQYDDRLSSLPDPILTDILSLLPIHTAAAASVLSHRWRHLWTAVTRLEYDGEDETFLDHILVILPQLTASKLRSFHLNLSSGVTYNLESHDLEPIYREICRRYVETVSINLSYDPEVNYFLPACFFKTQSIVCLEFNFVINCAFVDDDFKIGDVNVPNLKKLSLKYMYDVPCWFGNLLRGCPRLEDLELGFQLDNFNENADYMEIYGPNLKKLKIDLIYVTKETHTDISIDAPELECLSIRDCTSFYDFVESPTKLVRASIDLIKEDQTEDGDWLPSEGYFQNMFKFIGKMCSVSRVDLKLESITNIFAHLGSLHLPVFGNVVNIKMAWKSIGLKGWNEFLMVSFHYWFPNLKHLDLTMGDYDDDLLNEWSEPGFVPDCLISKLKTIHIRGLLGLDQDLNLLAYILSNAAVLNVLDVCIRARFKDKFRMSLFDLPRSSSTCEVVLHSCHCYYMPQDKILFCTSEVHGTSNGATGVWYEDDVTIERTLCRFVLLLMP